VVTPQVGTGNNTSKALQIEIEGDFKKSYINSYIEGLKGALIILARISAFEVILFTDTKKIKYSISSYYSLWL